MCYKCIFFFKYIIILNSYTVPNIQYVVTTYTTVVENMEGSALCILIYDFIWIGSHWDTYKT